MASGPRAATVGAVLPARVVAAFPPRASLRVTLRRHGPLLVLTALLVVLSAIYVQRHSLGAQTLGRLEAARSAAGVRPLVLPANFASLTPDEQLVLLINNERLSRGLAPGLVSRVAAPQVMAGLFHGRDPVPLVSLPGIIATDTIWGWSSLDGATSSSVTAAALEYIDYSWVYNDGWNGSLAATTNVDCTGPGAPGCWGHRQAVLSPDLTGATLVIVPGVAYTTQDHQIGTSAAAELIWTTDPRVLAATRPVS